MSDSRLLPEKIRVLCIKDEEFLGCCDGVDKECIQSFARKPVENWRRKWEDNIKMNLRQVVRWGGGNWLNMVSNGRI
jgi:hypothetical protein